MTAAQQHRAYGVSAQASGDMVIIQVGGTMRALTPTELRGFLKSAARELFRAEAFELEQQLRREAVPC